MVEQKLHPDSILQQLERQGFSEETRQNLAGLLNALMTTFADADQNDGQTMQRLSNAFSDHGNLLALIQQQAAELDALKRITFNLTASLELEAVLKGVVHEAMQLVKDAENAHIFLYQNQKIVFGAALKANGKDEELFSEPRPEGLTYQIARTGELLVVEDIQKHPLFHEAPPNWMGSIIGIPLKMGTRVIGVMNLARTRTGDFSQAEIRLLTLLADQAAIAIINARLHQAVSQQARSDALTGLPNRRALDECLEDAIMRSEQSGTNFCVIMMDLDGFKPINDTYGHNIGDDVLCQVSRNLRENLRSRNSQENLRSSDFLARYGGDELTLVLSDTDLKQARVVAEKIKTNLANLEIRLPNDATTHLTISGGMALYPNHANSAQGMMRAADEALYRAKRSGGNCFLVAQDVHA